ncbi:class I SAM-dependent methyltransferase [Cohnella ginsengisoli]|uniref:Class I SAM-dependent methyltransferase n=1 Tax=Cohnella ginsengisoli TaxID=425004 RepID=A0A9X4KMG6_9BACL|nr:class I SAM-dependent methyltransferase [Cohnella ginsengisoli]MDG0794590.1 class I SAM-dependent methyltransferase [Cohnella ginsengisoli]
MIEKTIQEYCLNRYLFLKDKNIYIFGAGLGGRLTVQTLNKLGILVEGVFDNDPQKWGSDIHKTEIISPELLKTMNTIDSFIIVAVTSNQEEVKEQLNNFGRGALNYEVALDGYIPYGFERAFEKFAQETHQKEYKDIGLQMQKIALKETATFVLENMFSAKQYWGRMDLLKAALEHVTIKGLYLEFGVYKGESINYISEIKRNEIIHGFDSFEGLPEGWIPGFEEGAFSVSALPEVNPNVKLIKGWFDESLPAFKLERDEQCAFIHVDCDLYSSTKTIFDLLKERIVKGTVIVFDEFFNYPNWRQGEYKAFQELATENNLNYEFIGYTKRGHQVGLKII